MHCGHDDVYAVLDVGWIMLFGKDSQQAADQALILRKVCELSLNPGMNIQDGFLTSHLERTFYKHEAELMREFLGSQDDIIECPTESQRALFGPTRRRVPRMIDLQNPLLLGPVQNQENYMQGVIARRDNFTEPILGFLEQAYDEFAELTGRHYGLISGYRTDDAETVFLALGSAAENIEAAVDLLRSRGESVGVYHLNVIRPFPEVTVVKALAGKKNVIVVERTDESMAGANPMARDVRTALLKGLENSRELSHAGIPEVRSDEMPRVFNGVYGLGSRDFRPEGILGACEYVTGKRARTDGKLASDGESFFAMGIDHPYEVRSDETPSLLPENAISVRFHSIGGWGMITTGKNLGEIIGELGTYVSERDHPRDEFGRLQEVVHVSANPKYGSEKKGAPTSYFLVVAPERIRVNCDLHHVNVVLCCDPKIFTHANPLEGLVDKGAFVWESEETPENAWERIPPKHRTYIIEHKIRVFLLPGFDIAHKATTRADLQLRMQGNAFLGAFFRVSTFLDDNTIALDYFDNVVRQQYVKKFGRFGDVVVDSNMEVMRQGFGRVTLIEPSAMDAPDRSSMRGTMLLPMADGGFSYYGAPKPAEQAARSPLFEVGYFDNEFRSGYGYDQPATPLASVGMMAAGTGATASKYVARREKPVFIPENCMQCMHCITDCPDTALPNAAQDIETVLRSTFNNYVTDPQQRRQLLDAVPELDASVRARMVTAVKDKADTPFSEIIKEEIAALDFVSLPARREVERIADTMPVAFTKATTIFGAKERKLPGEGGRVHDRGVRPLQGLCGLCRGVWRPRCASDGTRERRPQRVAPEPDGVLGHAARHTAALSRAV